MEPPQQNLLARLSQNFWTAVAFIQQVISNILNPENEQPNEAEQILPAERAAGQEDVTTGVSRPGNRQEAAATAECCHGDQEAEVALTRQTDFETPAVSCHGTRKRNAQGVVAGGRTPGVQWDLRGTEQVKTHKEVCSRGEVSNRNRQREVIDSKNDIAEPSEERVPEEGCRDSRQEAAPGGQDVGDTEVRGRGGQSEEDDEDSSSRTGAREEEAVAKTEPEVLEKLQEVLPPDPKRPGDQESETHEVPSKVQYGTTPLSDSAGGSQSQNEGPLEAHVFEEASYHLQAIPETSPDQWEVSNPSTEHSCSQVERVGEEKTERETSRAALERGLGQSTGFLEKDRGGLELGLLEQIALIQERHPEDSVPTLDCEGTTAVDFGDAEALSGAAGCLESTVCVKAEGDADKDHPLTAATEKGGERELGGKHYAAEDQGDTITSGVGVEVGDKTERKTDFVEGRDGLSPEGEELEKRVQVEVTKTETTVLQFQIHGDYEEGNQMTTRISSSSPDLQAEGAEKPEAESGDVMVETSIEEPEHGELDEEDRREAPAENWGDRLSSRFQSGEAEKTLGETELGGMLEAVQTSVTPTEHGDLGELASRDGTAEDQSGEAEKTQGETELRGMLDERDDFSSGEEGLGKLDEVIKTGAADLGEDLEVSADLEYQEEQGSDPEEDNDSAVKDQGGTLTPGLQIGDAEKTEREAEPGDVLEERGEILSEASTPHQGEESIKKLDQVLMTGVTEIGDRPHQGEPRGGLEEDNDFAVEDRGDTWMSSGLGSGHVEKTEEETELGDEREGAGGVMETPAVESTGSRDECHGSLATAKDTESRRFEPLGELQILDVRAQKSRIALRNKLSRPPRAPKELLQTPSLAPSPPTPQKLPRPEGMGLPFRLPGLGAGLPTLRKRDRDTERVETEPRPQIPSVKGEPETRSSSDAGTLLQAGPKPEVKPKWTPPGKAGFGMIHPQMMSELQNKLKKPQKD